MEDIASLSPENLQARIAAAEEIHRRAHERDREHQRVLDALAAAELNLKSARNSEAQARDRAEKAEAALARSNSSAGIGPEAMAALERQLGEARRVEATAVAEAASLRQQLDEQRKQRAAAAGDSPATPERDEAGKAKAELAAAISKLNILERELESVKARNAQLESAALTIQTRSSGPPPELREARAEADKARHAARSAEGNAARLRKELADALTRIKGLETTLAATRAAIAVSPPIPGGANKNRNEAADLRKQLSDARSEIGRLRNQLQQNGPRPPRDPREQRGPRDQRDPRGPKGQGPRPPRDAQAPQPSGEPAVADAPASTAEAAPAEQVLPVAAPPPAEETTPAPAVEPPAPQPGTTVPATE